MQFLALTEAEALLKECRIVEIKRPSVKFAKCSGSQCMGWRWMSLDIDATVSPVTQKQITQYQAGRGYCGYAGRI